VTAPNVLFSRIFYFYPEKFRMFVPTNSIYNLISIVSKVSN